MNIGNLSGYFAYAMPAQPPSSSPVTRDAAESGGLSAADAVSSGGPSVKETQRKSSPEECQTCKERKYQDGSNENVSFKSASHISPDAAAQAVRAHEGEHVANAYSKASEGNGKVISASVSIHTSICPECGRTYVSGGTTNTQIRYSDESNPYQQNQKALDALALTGSTIDYAA